MAFDRLFKDLCDSKVMQVGWHLAQADSRDDFVTDPIGHADYTSNLEGRLQHIVEQVQTHRYRPRSLLEIDIPKSGLSVRPGNVLPIEEASLLHAIVYLLAPILDKKLDPKVYSYRLHPDWRTRVKKRESLFREAPIEIPFLKRETIQSISPFGEWYDLWTDFEAVAIRAHTDEGFTHLTKTDIAAYFENIDLQLLETQIRTLLKREEEKILQVLFRVLEGWTRVTSAGTPIGRGIPQGNEISSFLGNIYLVPLDRALNQFCAKRDAKWFRYVDDVKVFTKSDHDAREAVFVVNDVLRSLHLNLQGSKTEVLYGEKLKYELDDVEIESVNQVIETVRNLNPTKSLDRKKITDHLKKLRLLRSRFTNGLPKCISALDTKQNRLFRRLMTLFGNCKRPHFINAAFTALQHFPDLRMLRKSLSYLSQLEIQTHQKTAGQLFQILDAGKLPFPYQVATVFETIGNLHPAEPKAVASRIRQLALVNKHNWLVVQQALEAIAVYPYPAAYAQSLAEKYLQHEHPMVRRAACVLLTRAPKHEVRNRFGKLIYHADSGVSRLALYFHRFIRDKEFSQQELARLRNGAKSEIAFQRGLSRVYALAASEEKATASGLYGFLTTYPEIKSVKLRWHHQRLLERTAWATK